MQRLTRIYTSCITLHVTHEEYRHALDAAIKEYESLGAQRRDIDGRLSQLAQTIATLSRLPGLPPPAPPARPAPCPLVPRPGLRMPPTQARERLSAIGVDL